MSLFHLPDKERITIIREVLQSKMENYRLLRLPEDFTIHNKNKNEPIVYINAYKNEKIDKSPQTR